MKLDEVHKKHLLELISEGLQTDEINARAAKFESPYSVSRSQVDFYRKSRGTKLKEIQEASESDALKTGFALKEKRVEVLSELAERMAEELLKGGRLWLEQVKALGSGEFMQIVDYEEFNGAEVAQLRGTLDDIAKEVGDRKTKLEHTGKDGKDLVPPTLSITIEPPTPLQAGAGAAQPGD
jgi:hypothetical protein